MSAIELAGKVAVVTGASRGLGLAITQGLPDPFHTDATKGWSRSEAFSRHAQSALPLKRAGDPAEIVGAVLYLVSDLASFTTGACLAVDGGAGYRVRLVPEALTRDTRPVKVRPLRTGGAPRVDRF